MNIDKEGIRTRVKPLLDKCYGNLKDASDKMPLIKKNMPSDFENSREVLSIEDDISTIKTSVNDINKWISSIIEKFNNVERKNEQMLAQIFYEGGSYTKAPTTKTTAGIPYDYDWGTFESCNNEYISGYYTGTKGRIFQTCFQHYETEKGRGKFFGVDYNGKCNRAAEATIISGYTDKSMDIIIQDLNNIHKDGCIIAPQEYWNKYGLERSDDYYWCYEEADRVKKGDTEVEGTYEDILLNHLQTTDGCALVWVTTGSVYTGESGRVWVENDGSGSDTTGVHWVSVVDYRVVDGQVQIAIADPGINPEANLEEDKKIPVGWYDIGEFQNGVSRMVLINET